MNRPSTQQDHDGVRERIDATPPAPSTPTTPRGRPLVASSVLLVVGVTTTVIATFMPWNIGGSLVGDEVWNGWQQIAVNIAAGRSYGITMTIAFALAFIGGILCLVAAGVGLARGRLAWAAITGGVLILLGTLGTFLGYVALGALDESYVGGWVFCFSWIPTLAGVAGHVGRRY